MYRGWEVRAREMPDTLADTRDKGKALAEYAKASEHYGWTLSLWRVIRFRIGPFWVEAAREVSVNG